MQAGKKTKFGVCRRQVVDQAQAILLRNIGELDARFFTYFAAHSSKWVGSPIFQAVEAALKEAADDVIASNIDINAPPFIEQDVAVAGLHDGTNGQRVAQFPALTIPVELWHA